MNILALVYAKPLESYVNMIPVCTAGLSHTVIFLVIGHKELYRFVAMDLQYSIVQYQSRLQECHLMFPCGILYHCM